MAPSFLYELYFSGADYKGGVFPFLFEPLENNNKLIWGNSRY